MLFRERQQIVICVAAAVMVISFVLLGYLPLRKKIKGIEQAKAAQSLVISKMSSEAVQLPAVREQLLKLQKTVGKYEENIPPQRALGVFVQQVTGLMDMHNLREQQVQPAEEVTAGELSCIPVNMRCKGSLKQLYEFFKSLQKSDRVVRIERIELANEGNFGGEVSMQTKAIIYYRAQANRG